jgi:hypothetical protein
MIRGIIRDIIIRGNITSQAVALRDDNHFPKGRRRGKDTRRDAGRKQGFRNPRCSGPCWGFP